MVSGQRLIVNGHGLAATNYIIALGPFPLRFIGAEDWGRSAKSRFSFPTQSPR
jgi:hypothetical protein